MEYSGGRAKEQGGRKNDKGVGRNMTYKKGQREQKQNVCLKLKYKMSLSLTHLLP
jgi:hypothetical protein